jgi:hypothetical protein
VILKLGLDTEGLSREAFALKCFSGFGAANLSLLIHEASQQKTLHEKTARLSYKNVLNFVNLAFKGKRWKIFLRLALAIHEFFQIFNHLIKALSKKKSSS